MTKLAYQTPVEVQESSYPQQHVFVVLNPIAGNVNVEEVRRYLEAFLTAQNWSYEFYETVGHDDLAKVVQEKIKAGATLVIAVGGDGTLSEVVNGLIDSSIPLAVIPLGTGNVVAHELGIPLNLEEACQLLIQDHKIRHLDVMQVGHRFFISHISLGLYSLIVEEIKPEQKRRFGRMIYVWQAIRKMMGKNSWRFELQVDDLALSVRASFILVANAGSVGLYALRWGQHISPDDQHLTVCIIKSRSITDYLKLLWNMARNRHYLDQNIVYLNARQKIAIETAQPVPVRADGDIIGKSQVQIQVIPAAVRILTR
ncbi:MAG: diacylglycerol kinase family lipid kinase [Anaerolineae bacterium]|nr:diacylglycerol kinase family lipid kinase [Anaerolineae bacterium]